MAVQVSPLQANALALILMEMKNKISILETTFNSKKNYCDVYPGLQLSQRKQELQEAHSFVILKQIIKNTIDALSKQNNFLPFFIAIKKIKTKIKESEKALKDVAASNEEVRHLYTEKELITVQLHSEENPGNKAKIKKALDDEERLLFAKRYNKTNYFFKYLETKRKGSLKKMKLVEDDFRKNIQAMQKEIYYENRCTQEIEFFLRIRKMELDDEFEACLKLCDEKMTDIDNKMEVLRIRKGTFQEETAKGETLLAKRAVEIQDFLKYKGKVEKEKFAVDAVQNWWRLYVQTNPKLLEITRKTKSKTVKKKKK